MLGYACINLTLSDVRPKKCAVTTNRSMIKRTFRSRGIEYASELALKNAIDLEKIVHWNEANGIKFFRVSSNLVPWASEFHLCDMPDYDKFAEKLYEIGKYVHARGHRITFHPGPFNKLTSEKNHVIQNTICDLETHGKIFDLMGLSRTPYNKINIHVGGANGDKQKALATFRKNFEKLSESVKSRLTVENDDRPNLFSVKDLYDGVYQHTKVPIVFDYHHHKFCDGGLSEYDALNLAVSTWGNIKPVTHYSETKRNNDGTLYYRPQAHSDYVYSYIDTHGQDIDVMIEAKAKELAVLRYKNDWERVAVLS